MSPVFELIGIIAGNAVFGRHLPRDPLGSTLLHELLVGFLVSRVNWVSHTDTKRINIPVRPVPLYLDLRLTLDETVQCPILLEQAEQLGARQVAAPGQLLHRHLALVTQRPLGRVVEQLIAQNFDNRECIITQVW